MSVQSAHNSSASNVSSLAATFGSAVSNNGLVRGFVSWDDSNLAALTGVTDDMSNSYTIVDKVADAVQGWAVASFYKEGITNGPTVITANINPGNPKPMNLCIAEESGFSALDGHAGQQQTTPGTGANAISSGNVTTTVDGDLICSCVIDLNLTNAVHGTNFSDRESDTAVSTKMKCEDLTQTSLGAIAGTWTDAVRGGNDRYITLAMAFKAAATGGIASANMMSSPGRFIGWTA